VEPDIAERGENRCQVFEKKGGETRSGVTNRGGSLETTGLSGEVCRRENIENKGVEKGGKAGSSKVKKKRIRKVYK